MTEKTGLAFDEVRRRHPNWNIGLSNRDRFWAFQSGATVSCLDADHVEELDRLLDAADQANASASTAPPARRVINPQA